MRRRTPPTNTGRPEPPSRSQGERRMDQADYARDAKREGAMCAYGLCTHPKPSFDVPDWSGRYGGSSVCKKHAETLGYDPDTGEWHRDDESDSDGGDGA